MMTMTMVIIERTTTREDPNDGGKDLQRSHLKQPVLPISCHSRVQY